MKQLINTINCIASNEMNRMDDLHNKEEVYGMIAKETCKFSDEMERFTSDYKKLVKSITYDFDWRQALTETERSLSAMLAEGVKLLAVLKNGGKL